MLLAAGLDVPDASAQQASQPGFDTRQTEKRFEEQSGQATPARSPLTLPVAARPGLATADTRPQFVLSGISLSGAEAIPAERLAAVYRPYIGKKVSQADLATIAGAISDIYRSAGFHLSRAIIPPQDVEGGRIRVEVIEGSIEEIELKGDSAENFGIRPILAPVLAEHPARLSTLERQLLLVNARAGMRIADSALDEIGGTTGRFRLTLTLKTWHLYTSFAIDNLGSSSVGPWQTYATGAFNSYLLPGDTLALNLSTIANDPHELAFARMSYDVPVGTEGARLGATAVYSEVHPGDVRRLYNDWTSTEAIELRGSIVPILSQSSALTLTVAAGFSNVSERDVFGPIYNDRIRAISFSSDYRLQDGFGGNNYLTTSFRQGLGIFGATGIGDPLVSHRGASSDFSVLNFWFTRYQALNDAWSLKMSAASQTASGPLFTSQQFYLGGAAFGRGYGSAEVSGDNGLAGTLELRFDQTLNWRYWSGYQLYGFFEGGAVWNDGYGIGNGASLMSAGAGVRFFLWNDLQADLGVAFPLGYRAPDNERHAPRFLFSLSSALRLCPERSKARCS